MVGVVGYIKTVQSSHSPILKAMIKTLQWTNKEQVNMWNDNLLSIAQVSHSIINTDPQPIFNEDNSKFIMMEGCIYDYEKLKKDLLRKGHKFKFENNDAEYCLHLYEEFGDKAFKKLNGCFIIAIYDLFERKLLLVNDRFSSRNLFYYFSTDGLIFGTQLSSVLTHSHVPRDLRKDAIFEFFTFQRVLGTKTYYKNVNVLESANILTYCDGNFSSSPYWQMRFRYNSKKIKHPYNYYTTKLAVVLKNSVRRKTSMPHQYGVLLSGGLDSRMVVAALEKEVTAFTFGDFINNEIRIAKRIAETKKNKHVFLKRKMNHYVNLLDDAVKIGDGMYRFTHAHSIGFFNGILKETDILLNGYLSDTLFKGACIPYAKLNIFNSYIDLPLLETIKTDAFPDQLLSKAPDSLYKLNPKQLFEGTYSANYDSVIRDSLNQLISKSEGYADNVYDKFHWFYINHISKVHGFLFELSLRQFTISESLMLDNDVLDFCLELPIKFRSNHKLWISALLQLNSNLAIMPDSNNGVSPFIPSLIKWGLDLSQILIKKLRLSQTALPHPTYQSDCAWPNMSELLRHNVELKRIVIKMIDDPESIPPSIFNIDRIKQVFIEHVTGRKNHVKFLYLLITFGRWHKLFGPHNVNKD